MAVRHMMYDLPHRPSAGPVRSIKLGLAQPGNSRTKPRGHPSNLLNQLSPLEIADIACPLELADRVSQILVWRCHQSSSCPGRRLSSADHPSLTIMLCYSNKAAALVEKLANSSESSSRSSPCRLVIPADPKI